MSSHTSRVRGVTPMARQQEEGSVNDPTARAVPREPAAIVRPTGPAPTTRTSVARDNGCFFLFQRIYRTCEGPARWRKRSRINPIFRA